MIIFDKMITSLGEGCFSHSSEMILLVWTFSRVDSHATN